MADLAHVGTLAPVLAVLALATLASWELRLWRVRCGVRCGHIALVTCHACGRRVPDAWPHVNTSKTCAVCARARHVGAPRRTAPAVEPRRVER